MCTPESAADGTGSQGLPRLTTISTPVGMTAMHACSEDNLLRTDFETKCMTQMIGPHFARCCSMHCLPLQPSFHIYTSHAFPSTFWFVEYLLKLLQASLCTLGCTPILKAIALACVGPGGWRGLQPKLQPDFLQAGLVGANARSLCATLQYVALHNTVRTAQRSREVAQ